MAPKEEKKRDLLSHSHQPSNSRIAHNNRMPIINIEYNHSPPTPNIHVNRINLISYVINR